MDVLNIGQVDWDDAAEHGPAVFGLLAELRGQLPWDEPRESAAPREPERCASADELREHASETVRRWRAARSPEKAAADRERERLRRRASRAAAKAAKVDIDAQEVAGSPAQLAVADVVAGQVEAEDGDAAIDWLMRQRPG